MKRITGCLLLIGLALSSIYLFPSGTPQVGDYFLLAFSLCVLYQAVSDKKIFPLALLPLSWLFLVFWVTLVSVVWGLIYQSSEFVEHALFFVYNAMVPACLLFYLNDDEHATWFLKYGVVLALLVSFIGLMLELGTWSRPSGFFNNPNQLAYFSVLGLAILMVINEGKIFSGPVVSAAYVSGIMGAVAPASFAGIGAVLFIVFGLVVINFRVKNIPKLIVGGVIASLLVFLLLPNVVDNIESNVKSRIDRSSHKFENIVEERKYERILHFPEHILLGAGEGHRERFIPFDKNEIHSSFGTLLFSYGVIGLFLFLALLMRVMKGSGLCVTLALLAPLAYSITHMGLRSTYFWILFVIVIYLKDEHMRLSRV